MVWCKQQISCGKGLSVCWEASRGCYCEAEQEDMPLIPTLLGIAGALAPVIGAGLAPIIGNAISGKMAYENLQQEFRTALAKSVTTQQDLQTVGSVLGGLTKEFGPGIVQAATGCLVSPKTCKGTLKGLAQNALPTLASDAVTCLVNKQACEFATPAQGIQALRTATQAIARQSLKFKFNM